jgi:hypothetical protein
MIQICSVSASVQSFIPRDFWMEFYPGGQISPEDRQRLHEQIKQQFLEGAA